MTGAGQPSGPGTPIKERREAATEREGLDELAADDAGVPVDAPAEDAAAAARHAVRDAHTPRDAEGESKGGKSGS